MSVTGWLGYARTVLGRALATTGRLTWSKLAFGAYMAVLVALFTGWYAADVGLPFSLALILAAVVSAALVTLALFFMGSLLAAPYALHAEQAAAADAAAQACAAETARLTAALVALDDTVQRRARRDALGQFLLEGNALLPRILARTSGADDVQAWVERVVQHVRDTRGATDVARLLSDADLRPTTPMDPDPGGATGWKLIRDGRDNLWRAVHNRCARLQQFLEEDGR